MSDASDSTVLVAVDGSHNSILAAGVGARLAQLLGMQIALVHVLDAPVLTFWTGVEARIKNDLSAQAKAMLEGVAGTIRRCYDVAPKFFIVDGEPVHEIGKLARAHAEIIMVVTGREGLGSEKRTELLRERAGDHLGAKLGDRIPLPVLVVPPDLAASMICESLEEFRKGTAA